MISEDVALHTVNLVHTNPLYLLFMSLSVVDDCYADFVCYLSEGSK